MSCFALCQLRADTNSTFPRNFENSAEQDSAQQMLLRELMVNSDKRKLHQFVVDTKPKNYQKMMFDNHNDEYE